MNFLGIDTTKDIARIVLFANNKKQCFDLSVKEKHSESLLFSIDKILNENNLSLNDIDYYGIVNGAGSFTGIRVGLATIKAFGKVMKKQCVVLNNFEIIADYIENGTFLLKCSRNTFYYAKIKNNIICDYGCIDEKNLSNMDNAYCIDDDKEYLKNINVKIINNFDELLINNFDKKLTNKDFNNTIDIKPFYLLLSQAERNESGVDYE